MKILFANKFFYHKGGAESVFFQERNYLKHKLGLNVIDFSMASSNNFESRQKNFFVSHVDYHEPKRRMTQLRDAVSFIHSKEAVKKIESLVKQEKPDVAHLHNIYHQITPSIIPVLKKYNIKVFLTLHDYKLVCPAYLMLNGNHICDACINGRYWKPFMINCQESRRNGLLLMLEAYWHKVHKSYDLVDKFIAPSAFIKNVISARIPESKIKILHNGVDTSSVRASFKDEGYALFLGRFSKEKGVNTLLEAHAQSGGCFPLKLAGTGPLLKTLSYSYAGNPNVEFSGFLQGKKLIDLIKKAAFVIVPSEWNENCSMTVLEAMSYGKPVIASNVGGLPEQVDHQKTGFLFEMGNKNDLSKKMMSLHANTELRKRMGRAARGKIEKKYNLESHIQNLLKIYTS